MSGTAIVGLSFVAGGAGLLWLALRARAGRMRLLADCAETNGTIVRLEETTSDDDVVTTHSPIVAYRAPGGATHELALPPRHDIEKCRLGKKVRIFYQRSDPANAHHALRTWDVNLACGLSFIPLLVGAGCFFTLWQESRANPAPAAASASAVREAAAGGRAP
ncbi:MAG TPA: DUF3592 domain-containing protein [Planctomycetia bacterium]|nr:DUF3592 domain-containing protein [Planctomycetia bacterium]